LLSKRVRLTTALAFTGATAVALLTSAGGAAASASTPVRTVTGADVAAVDPVPELASLASFVGQWHCQGTYYVPGGATVPVVSDSTIQFELGGHWLVWNSVENSGTPGGGAQIARSVWGRDAASQQFSVRTYDSTGGLTDETSAGWSGDTLVTEGTTVIPNGSRWQSRTTFTRSDATHFSSVSDANVGAGWEKVFETACSR
jgi:hypothetical protein